MKRFRWQILVAVAGVVAILLLLLAVKGPILRPNSPTVQAVRGGTYREALVGSLQRLNPLLDSYNQPDRDVDRLIFSGLVGFDSTGAPIPDLAAGWVISDDGLSYTVILRPDVTWHDGEPITPRDVLYTYGLLQDKNYPGPPDLARLWRSVKVAVHDERTVVFTLPEPFAPFLDFLSQGLLPEHLLRDVTAADLAGQTFNVSPVGSGPFRLDHLLVEQDRITGLVLKPYEKHYGTKAYLEEVEFRYLPSVEAAFGALEAGQVMGLGGLTPPLVERALRISRLQMFSAREPRMALVFFNLKNEDVPFFASREVRRALLLAVNRQRIIDSVLFGQAVLAAGPVLPGSWAADPAITPETYDPLQTERLLEGAGWKLPTGATPGDASYVRKKEETSLRFTLAHPDDAVPTRTAQMLQSMWAEVGVQVDLQAVPAGSLVSDYLAPRSYQAVLGDLSLARFPDPDPYTFWHQTQISSGQNYSQLDDRSISEVLEIARTEPNPANRAKLYRSFQYRFNYQVPALVLWYPTYSYALDVSLNGVRLGPLVDASDRLTSLSQSYLISAPATPETVSTP